MSYESYQSPSRRVLVKQASQGALALGGGIALMVFNGITSIPVVGPIIGGAMLVAGLITRNKRGTSTKADEVGSVAIMVLGGLSLATIIPGLGGLASFILHISALGLVGFGIWKLVQYFLGKSRY